MNARITDALLDKCGAAYREEFDRWSWRRKPENSGFELVRARGDALDEITNLTKRECKDSHDAESWLNTYRGRAAMRVVLERLAERAVLRQKRDPLRNNPVVGFMSEAQAERILAEMREERCR